jgi:hypothetical protein
MPYNLHVIFLPPFSGSITTVSPSVTRITSPLKGVSAEHELILEMKMERKAIDSMAAKDV